MPIPFLNDIDLSGILKILNNTGYLDLDKNEIRQAVVQNVATEPTTPNPGQIIHNTAKTDSVKGNGKFGYRTTTSWVYPDMEKSVYDTNNNGKVDVAENAELFNNQSASYYLNRANHTGTQPASTISDFTEAAQDAVASAFLDTQSIMLIYDDINNRIYANLKTFSGSGIVITANGVTLSETGVTAGTYTKVTVDVKGRVTEGANLTAGDLPAHTHTASDVTNFNDAVRSNRLDQMAIPTSALNLNNQRIANLAEPVNSSDAATKNYVDNAITGLSWKDSVRVATTGNITLSGTQTIDGIALSVGDRVLVKNQTTASQNGIYTVASSTWARATDADTWNELISASVFVEEGTVNADTVWICTVDRGGTLGTTPVTWTQFGGLASLVAGEGLSKTGNQIDVNVDNQSIQIVSDILQAKLDSAGGIVKTANGLKANVDGSTIIISSNQLTLNSAYKNKKFTSSITGDGSNTVFTINHGLATKDIIINVYEDTTGYTVFPLLERYDTNTVKVSFKTAPANGKVYKVVIIG